MDVTVLNLSLEFKFDMRNRPLMVQCYNIVSRRAQRTNLNWSGFPMSIRADPIQTNFNPAHLSFDVGQLVFATGTKCRLVLSLNSVFCQWERGATWSLICSVSICKKTS